MPNTLRTSLGGKMKKADSYIDRFRHFGRSAAFKAISHTLLAAFFVQVFAANALAHGERAQEPSLRLSTIQWYDTKWSSDHIGVNQELTLSGRFHVMANWPL